MAATTTTIEIDPEHPSLSGHFPGAPILPGVVLLDETLRAVERAAEHGPACWTIGAAKFLKPVRPGEQLTLEHERLPNGSVHFALSSGGRAVAQGVLRPVVEVTNAAAQAEANPGPAGASAAAAPRTSASHWARARERGNALTFSIMIFLSLTLGRRVARGLLYGITAYFLVFAPAAGRHGREYLKRALGREPRARDSFRQVFAFASTILDRLYLLKERFELFTVTTEGELPMRAVAARGTGAFLLGAHLGSFEIMSAVGRNQPDLRVAMAMYQDTASRMTLLTRAGDPARAPEIILLGHLGAMLRIRDCLDAGGFVGMLADRTIGEAPAQRVSFLGRPALLPSGPMRAAAALRRPVYFMTGLYRGANRYHVVFREIADFSTVARGEREARIEAAIHRYAALLEEYCRSDPYNWFNFYDFWHEETGAGARGAAA
jgi:predicted LPLAT superfamily acyltransferase/3-hydroxymyristoyl/3-hydroxydecanoyl-(acyl carrier protein) dehydratase